MNDVESLFNPQDDSLAEKVNAYYEVCRDYSRVQSSLKQTRDGKNTDYIGDHSEVMSAYEVISSSLALASNEVSSEDLQRAKEQGIISENQLIEMIQIKRSNEVRARRLRNENTDHLDKTLKR